MYMIMGPGIFKSRVASEIMRIPPNLAKQELGLDAHCNERVRLRFSFLFLSTNEAVAMEIIEYGFLRRDSISTLWSFRGHAKEQGNLLSYMILIAQPFVFVIHYAAGTNS